MTTQQKYDYMKFYVVGDCFCDMGIFIENVRYADGLISFNKKIEKCENESDIRKLVNQYI